MIRRTSTGWQVEGAFPALSTDTVDDLGHALVLADLLAEGTIPGPRPPRPPDGVDEVTRLQASVRQLEHALASRVVVEQAIGVLSERWRVAPRDAFEQLRRVTRSHGLRIHDLAKLVIESSSDPEVRLPAELVPAPRRSAGPPEPRQSPDGRGRGQGRTRRGRAQGAVPSQDSASAPAASASASGAPAAPEAPAAPAASPARAPASGGRPRVPRVSATAPAPGGRHAHVD